MNNPTKKNSAEDEINAIRIKLYEQTKNMTAEEQTVFFNNKMKDGFAKHGITPCYAPPPPARTAQP
ncbi:MAG: hypothetical protein LBS96_02465 [Oscillospiraceae bacterium]|jgi:hypothetical protein|nr:hypothetical protein [Oscillospiraceae bacterium]